MNSSTRILSLVTAAAALTVAGAVLAPSAALATTPPITPVLPSILHPSKLSISVDQNHVTPGSTVKVSYFLTDLSGNPIMGTETLSEKSADGSVNTVLASASSQYHKVVYTQAVTLTAPGLYTFALAWTPPAGEIAASDLATTQVQVLATGATGAASVGSSVANAPTPVTMSIKVPSAAYTTAGTVRVDLDGKTGVASCTTGPGATACTAQLPAGLAVGSHTADVTWIGVNYSFVFQSVVFTTKAAPKPAAPPASEATTTSHSTSTGTSTGTVPTATPSTPAATSTPTVAPQPAQVAPTPAAGPLTPTTVSSTSPIPVVLVIVGLTLLAFLIIGAIVLVTVIRRRRAAIA